MIKKIKLEEQDKWYDLRIIPENPYLLIDTIWFEGSDTIPDRDTFQLEYQFLAEDNSTYSGSLGLNSQNGSNVFLIREEEQRISTARNYQVQLTARKGKKLQFQTAFVSYYNIKLLDVSNPFNEFESHLSDLKTARILFSAPFGQGKTTFLNYFFESQTALYEVFKVNPINYSVAKNEDVFRYIKADLLYQLIVEKEVKFEKLPANYAQTIPNFIKSNITQILYPFLLLIPGVGKSLYSLYDKLNDVKDQFFEEHDNVTVDELEEGNKYLQELIEAEGSIYEDNFITQLIRQQVTSLKNQNKQTVLIIDDLDRMDPDHMFRILNLLSTHYDSHYLSEDYENNKFGFDKIILVCDLENIQNIFEHRYGSKVRFDGYMNKFYSTYPFEYDNTEMVLSQIAYKIDDIADYGQHMRHAIHLFYKPLIKLGEITLRDILKIKNSSLKAEINSFREKTYSKNYHFAYGLFTPLIMLLARCNTKEAMLKKIEILDASNLDLRGPHMNFAWYLIAPIAAETKGNNTLCEFETEDYYFNFQVSQNGYDYPIASNLKSHKKVVKGDEPSLIKNEDVIFTRSDMMDFLKQNILMYYTIRNM